MNSELGFKPEDVDESVEEKSNTSTYYHVPIMEASTSDRKAEYDLDWKIQDCNVQRSRHDVYKFMTVVIATAFVLNTLAGFIIETLKQDTQVAIECIKNQGTFIQGSCTQMKVNILPQTEEQQ